MSKFTAVYHTDDIKELAERWPKRAKWAMREAVAMAGGHYRKRIRAFIEGGGRGWKPLNPITGRIKSGRKTPLYNLGKLVRFKVPGGAQPRTQIGFFPQSKRGNAAWNKKERGRFKDFFGGTAAALARKHEFGKTYPVTPAKRRLMAALGAPLKPTTKHVTVPARPMIGPVWREESPGMRDYVGNAFWKKMTSREGTFK
jgi:hypothetical protein